MIKSAPIVLLALFAMGIGPLTAADSAATVTEAVNQVSHGSAQAAATHPAPPGTRLQDGEYLETGVKSRAELALANQSVTRLGANTILNVSAAKSEVDLQSGTLLFSKPKDGGQLNIKTASVTAAIVGTTGFAQKRGSGFLFGLVEGKATLTIGGVQYHVKAGEILKFTPGQPPQIYSFNVPVFLKTSLLITGFHHPLPNQSYIDQEVAVYDDLVARGFIQPAAQPYFVTDFVGSIPTLPILDNDSSGNARDRDNTPPPPPPPPQQTRPLRNPGSS